MTDPADAEPTPPGPAGAGTSEPGLATEPSTHRTIRVVRRVGSATRGLIGHAEELGAAVGNAASETAGDAA